MAVSRDYLLQCARENGSAPATLEKVIRLGEVADAIGRHSDLHQRLVLKGGTALNLCFGETPPRLSIDLDYNCLTSLGREKMLQERPGLEHAVTSLLQRLGFRIQRSSDTFAGRKLFASYRSVMGPDSRIELDLNYIWRVPLAEIERHAMWQPGELDRPSVYTVSFTELCLGKMLAFLDRTAPRDAYDLCALAERAPGVFQLPLLRRLLIAFSASLPLPLTEYDQHLFEKRLTDEQIQVQLAPMLAAGRQVDREMLLAGALKVISPYLALSSTEKEYTSQIAQGNLRLDLLFPDEAETAERLAQHPVLQWKIRNVREMRANKTIRRIEGS